MPHRILRSDPVLRPRKGRAVRTLHVLGIAIAAIVMSGTSRAQRVVLGEFSDPVLQGPILDPIPPHHSYYDNSSTASYLIANSTDGTLAGLPPGQRQGSAISWGTPGFSYLQFFGRTLPSDPTKPFDLGTIEFGNGTALETLIFGATLTFYLGPAEPDALQRAFLIGSQRDRYQDHR